MSRRDFFAHYERRGWLEQLFEFEATAAADLGKDIAGHAAQELTARLTQAVESLGSAVSSS